jgi:sulfatase modifying factor 1
MDFAPFTAFCAALAMLGLAPLPASAHPGSGITVDRRGQVLFQDAATRAVWKIDPAGQVSEFHTGIGGHWMCLDTLGSFSRIQPRYFARITPAGVAPAILLADGGAPLVVSTDGHLYYPAHSSKDDEFSPGGCQLVRMAPGGTRGKFAPALTPTLEKLDGVTGLAAGPGGAIYVASPTAIHRVQLDGTVHVVANPVEVLDCTEDAEPGQKSPFLRGLAVAEDGTVFAAATDCRRVVQISTNGKTETVLRSESPWTPTGVAIYHGHVYVLEYNNIAITPDLASRVRSVEILPAAVPARDGKITVLAARARDGNGMTSHSTAFAGARAGEEHQVAGLRLCWCPPGEFTMGSPPDEPGRRPDEARVRVKLTRGFWMGKYEVTQSQWKRVAGDIPGKLIAGEGDDFPVYWISFTEAEEYCRKLTELARSWGELPPDWEFRIPTEAQWEYACRAGTTTAFSCGDTLTSAGANIGKPYDGHPDGTPGTAASKVGSYPANPWGLHDMHGNEFEWCRDWYHQKLPGGDDPDLFERKGLPNRDGTFSRIRRGGAWTDESKFCRSALRLRYEPHRGADHIGFRVVAVRR